MQKREELYTLALQNMEWLAEQYLHRGEVEAGLRFTQRLLTTEPWNEEFHFLQMRLLVRADNRVAALRQYELCQHILHRELGVAPSTAITTFYEQVRGGLLAEEDFAVRVVEFDGEAKDTSESPTPSPPLPPHNLPRRLTDFVGRTTEITQVVKWITVDQKPLITLLGEGGMGKSNLALAVAQAIQRDERAAIRQQFEDGIWFVTLEEIVLAELAEASLRERLAARIGEALLFNFGGNGKLSTQLFSYLSHKALLLILDSFEDLTACASFIIDLLQAAQRIQIMITSRTAVGLYAEQLLQLRGLAFPEPELLHGSWEALLQYDAIALFCTLARRRIRDFTLSTQNVAAIAQICQFVAGSPLGILLATGLLDIYSCPQVATLLEQDYRVLRSAEADLPMRQRTIQHVLNAAWHRLDREQAEFLTCCSVLYGWFSRQAASAVAAQPDPPLHALVWQAWLRYDQEQQRYIMHDLLRQYVTKHGVRAPQLQAAHERHAVYHFQSLQEHEQRVRYDLTAVETLRIVWTNVRSAWVWATEQARLDLLEQGAQGLANFYQATGLHLEAIDHFEQSIALVRQRLATTQDPRYQRTLAHLLGCSLNFYRNDIKRMQAQSHEMLTLGRQLEDQICEAIALNGLSWATQWLNAREALAFAQQAHSRLATRNQPWLLAQTFKLLAAASMFLRDFNTGTHYYEQALAHLTTAPDTDLEARIYFDFGVFEQRIKQFMPAYQHLSTALRLAQSFQNRRTIGLVQLTLGDLWRDLGLYERSKESYHQAAAYLEPLEDIQWLGNLYNGLGRVLHHQGDLAGAERAYQMTKQAIQNEPKGVVNYHMNILIGHLLADQHALAAAATHYHAALDFHQRLKFHHVAPDAYAGLARIYLAQHDPIAAKEMANAALTVMAEQGVSTAEEPTLVYWRCFKVLQITADAKAEIVLAEARQYLHQKAGEIDDDAIRQTFLTEVAANRLLFAIGEG